MSRITQITRTKEKQFNVVKNGEFGSIVEAIVTNNISNRSVKRTLSSISLVIATILLAWATLPTAINAQVSVQAGEASMIGNGTSPVTAFLPQDIEINAGESVTWTNPTPVAEPHTITFLADEKFFAPPVALFTVPNSTDFTLDIQGLNAEPSIVPSSGSNITSKTVVIDNARSSSPVAIDSTGENVTFLKPNSTYTMQGNESYVNSGWMWPEGNVPPGAPFFATFTLQFENPGTYPYLCIVHPWMTGSVTVK
jgi:plastocyanin